MVAAGVHSSCVTTDRTSWKVWSTFCTSLHLDPSLAGVSDKIPILQMFAHQVRTSLLSAYGRHVCKQTVEQYLRSVAQIFASVGAPDSRLNMHRLTDFHLLRQFRLYDKQDPPPTQVRPVLLQLLIHLQAFVSQHPSPTDHQRAVTDLAVMAFFFLLCPREYCKSAPHTKSHSFCLRDLTFSVGDATHNAATTPINHILEADYVALYFTTQKNGVCGKALSVMVPQATQPRVRFLSSIAMSFTFDPSAPPDHSPLLSPGTPLVAYGARHRHRYVLLAPILGTRLASSPPTSLPRPYGPAVPCRSFFGRWTTPSSNSLGAGALIKSCATYTSPRVPLCRAMHVL
jgi:hypothetical protein